MTDATPPSEEPMDSEDAREAADAALEKARVIAQRGRMIARGWRIAREHNNFRAMIRDLGER